MATVMQAQILAEAVNVGGGLSLSFGGGYLQTLFTVPSSRFAFVNVAIVTTARAGVNGVVGIAVNGVPIVSASYTGNPVSVSVPSLSAGDSQLIEAFFIGTSDSGVVTGSFEVGGTLFRNYNVI